MKKTYKPIPLWDTANMSKEEFTHSRKEWLNGFPGIGGSDVAAILGLSKYKTPWDIYNDKIGVGEEFSGNEATETGHIMEPRIAELFKADMEAKGHKVELFNDTTCYQHGETTLLLDENEDIVLDENSEPIEVLKYPWARINLDRLVIVDGKLSILEIKTVDTDARTTIADWKAGFTPIGYEYQVRFYMACMNIDHAYVICAWGFKSNNFAINEISRDEEIEEFIMSHIDSFVRNFVIPHKEPEFSDIDATGEQAWSYYEKKYGVPGEKKERIELSKEDWGEDIRNHIDLQKKIDGFESKIKDLKKQQAEIEARILETLKDTEYAKVELSDTETANLNLPFSMTNNSYDVRAVVQDFEDAWDYIKVENTKFEKAHKAEAKKYLLPRGYTGKRKFELKTYEHKPTA